MKPSSISQQTTSSSVLLSRRRTGPNFPLRVRRTVPADAGFRRPADLGYAEPDDLFPGGLAFAGRNDHARIGDGKPQAGADLGKCFVVDAVAELVGIDVVSPLHPGYAYGVGRRRVRLQDAPRASAARRTRSDTFRGRTGHRCPHRRFHPCMALSIASV